MCCETADWAQPRAWAENERWSTTAMKVRGCCGSDVTGLSCGGGSPGRTRVAVVADASPCWPATEAVLSDGATARPRSPPVNGL